jgi:hypothetical protein
MISECTEQGDRKRMRERRTMQNNGTLNYLASVFLCLLNVALPLPLESLSLELGGLGLSAAGDHSVTGVLLVGVVLELAHHGSDVTLERGGIGGLS